MGTTASSNEKMNNYMKRTGRKYLDEVASREGVYKLKSGMLVEILKESTDTDAKSPNQGDTCDVTYSGTLKDGSPFDAGTTSFAPNQVIDVSTCHTLCISSAVYLDLLTSTASSILPV